MVLSDEIWAVLKPAAEIGDFATREDIEERLATGEFKLWIKNKSAAVTNKINNTLRIGLAGGDLKDLIEIEKDIEEFARSRYFNCIDILGREGWEKVFPDYKKKAVLLRKDIR